MIDGLLKRSCDRVVILYHPPVQGGGEREKQYSQIIFNYFIFIFIWPYIEWRIIGEDIKREVTGNMEAIKSIAIKEL